MLTAAGDRALVQLQSAAPEFETKLVLPGTASPRLTLVALDGPLLVTVTVQVMSLPQ